MTGWGIRGKVDRIRNIQAVGQGGERVGEGGIRVESEGSEKEEENKKRRFGRQQEMKDEEMTRNSPPSSLVYDVYGGRGVRYTHNFLFHIVTYRMTKNKSLPSNISFSITSRITKNVYWGNF